VELVEAALKEVRGLVELGFIPSLRRRFDLRLLIGYSFTASLLQIFYHKN
jgi:hypothetical protein